jgi:hypothetical protein
MRFHILARQAGLELEYTDDPIERIRRALAFIKICEWMLLEQMKKEIQVYRERVTQSGGEKAVTSLLLKPYKQK